MPEIIIPGLKDVGSGPSESQHEMRQSLVKNGQMQLWAFEGTEEECEASWRAFLLQGTPDWEILS